MAPKNVTNKRARSPDTSARSKEQAQVFPPLKRAKAAEQVQDQVNTGTAVSTVPVPASVAHVASDPESYSSAISGFPWPLMSDEEIAAKVKNDIYAGAFDLYAMSLKFLVKDFLPAGTKTPQYEALYKTILTYQAKPDRTAQMTIPAMNDLSDGTFRDSCFRDPMEEMPFAVRLYDVQDVANLEFASDELRGFPHAGNGSAKIPGITAQLEVKDGGCGIDYSYGYMKMRLVWEKEDTDGKKLQLFEGYVSIEVNYSPLYRRNGHGCGDEADFAFWAVHVK